MAPSRYVKTHVFFSFLFLSFESVKLTKKKYEDKSTKSLMMLPTDMALVQDKAFRPHVERYAKSNDEFFKDFSAVVLRLFELGVPFAAGNESQRWTMKPTWDESK